MDGKFEWSGKGFCGQDIQHQIHQYEYPAPGYPKIHMLWKYGGPWIGTMTATNRYAKMYTDPSLEFVVSQSIWFEGEVPFADVHPAGLHQLRALGHLGVRPLLGLHSATTTAR